MENMVSIWVGNFETEDEVFKYTSESYTEDGDWVSSNFCKEFFEGEELFEVDFFERYFVGDASADLRVLLEGCSYDESVILSLVSVVGEILNKEYNSVILIYDFAVDNTFEQIKGRVDYIATVPYQKI